MARLVETIGSNATGLYSAREIIPGKLPVATDNNNQPVVWVEKEPNEYSDFGAELNVVARQPINSDRQRKKGTTVGLSASAGYTTDLTASNFIEEAEEFLFAAAYKKNELRITGVLADGYSVAAGGDGFKAGALLFAEGSSIRGNNGLKLITANGAANKVSAAGLAVAGAGGRIIRVGHQFAAGDAEIDATGELPVLTAGDIDFRTLGVQPGEVIYIGDDDDAHNFVNAANKGWARVLYVDELGLTFDKTDAVFITEAPGAKTIRIYFGTVIKNEKADKQRAYSRTLRRMLGKVDLDAAAVQSECVIGCVANELTISIPEEDKITCELSYIARDYQTFKNDAVDVGGVFQAVEEADAINSTVDAVRASMVLYGEGSVPIPVFAVFQEFDLSINNNISENKAVTRLGAFALTPGFFEVSGSFTGYFVTVDSLQAVRENADASFLFSAWKDYKGFAYDLPMITLSTDGLNVEINEPITVDIDAQAATGRSYNRALDHTALIVFYDYLPKQAAK